MDAKLRKLSVLLCLGVISSLPLVQSTCYGDACNEEHAAATSHGLLGASSPTCAAKQYPQDGSKLQPELLPGSLFDLRWNGQSHELDKYVFAMTVPEQRLASSSLLRSADYGRPHTWTDITSQLPGVDASKRDITGVKDISMHPNNTRQMLFQGLGYHHWISNDFGQSFKAVETPGRTLGFWASLKHHPTQTQWLLSKVTRNDCVRWDDGYQFYYVDMDVSRNPWCAHDLFRSEDFGVTWENLTENSAGAIASFWDYDWAAVLHHGESNPLPDRTILATAYESAAHMKGLYPGWDKDIHFVRSDDYFKSQHTKLASCGNQFEVIGNKVFLAMPSNCPTNPDGSKRKVAGNEHNVMLYSSADEGNTFEQACLPVKDLDLGYSLVATHDRRGTFIIVDHDEQDQVTANAPISNVYSQGWNSSLFSLSLPRNFRRTYTADFARVEGLPGVLLANQLSREVLDEPPQSWGFPDYEGYVQTKVSFSGGATWQDLALPSRYRYTACNRCRPGDAQCRLHLHGPSSWYSGPGGRPSFYSHTNAPGIIMAVGNTGRNLDLAADDLCTWLSQDGGVTWEDVYPGAGIYEFGDHGGILVLAPHRGEQPATHIKFSLDQGQCWHNISLAEAIDIENIRVESRGGSHVFVVHGEACRKTATFPSCSQDHYGPNQGRMYVLDFKALMGSEWRDCDAGDYERWTPLSPQGDCLAGERLSLERRKRDAACFNGKDRERSEATRTLCPCEAVDMECEFGYEPTPQGCVKMAGIGADQCGEISSKGYLTSSTNHRLVHGNVCTDVQRIIPDTNGHGGLPGTGGSGAGGSRRGHGWLITVIILLAVAGAVAAAGYWVVFRAGDGVRAALEETTAPLVGFISSGFAWARDRFSGVAYRRQAQEAYFEPLPDSELGLEEIDGRSPPLRPL